MSRSYRYAPGMGNKIGYARCSTDNRNLAAIPQMLLELGPATDLTYLDRAHPGIYCVRPTLEPALPAGRPGSMILEPADVATLLERSGRAAYRVPEHVTRAAA